MKDQPLFEVDDTTTSYSPPRGVRRRWVDGGRADTPEQPTGTQHWFDPDTGRARRADGWDSQASPQRPGARVEGGPRMARDRRPLIGAGIAIAIASAIVAVMGTLGFLAAGGWLDAPDQRVHPLTVSASPSSQALLGAQPPDADRIAAEVGPAIVRVVVGVTSDDPLTAAATRSTAIGVVASGIVYHQGGWILTNRHVVCGADVIVVLLPDGRRLAAQVYGIDSLTDLAIIRVDASGLPAADIGDSATVRPGQMSVVVATSATGPEPIATSGVVSALGQDLVVADPCLDGQRRAIRNVIQTDGRFDDVIAGGALVDGAGAVVGIGTFVPGDIDTASFAIPINLAKPIMEQAVEGKPLSRPYMGITYTTLDAQIAKAHDLTIDHGAWLRGSPDGTLPAVVPGGPADQAGLREGDILTAIDDQRIDASHSLDEILSQYRPEDQDPIEVSVLRGGTPVDRVLTLGIR